MKEVVRPVAVSYTPAHRIEVEQTERQANSPVRLHCNESPFDLPPFLKEELALKMAHLDWNRYPDMEQTELKSILAQHAGLLTEQVVIGNGSSQLIAQIVACFAKFLSCAIIESPTFTFYHQVCANEHLPYQEWTLTPAGHHQVWTFPETPEPALVILTSPNNPTGATLPLSVLKVLLEKHGNCIFVIDEAYGEFGGESAASLVKDYHNLLVIKTLSKGWGLPSVRFGYVLGDEKLLAPLKKTLVPFTVNIFTEMIVREFLTNPAIIQALKVNRERIINLRNDVYQWLNEMSSADQFRVFPSEANFLLLWFSDTALLTAVKEALSSQHILVGYPMPGALRLSIGTEAEMHRVLQVFKQVLGQFGSQHLPPALANNDDSCQAFDEAA